MHTVQYTTLLGSFGSYSTIIAGMHEAGAFVHLAYTLYEWIDTAASEKCKKMLRNVARRVSSDEASLAFTLQPY